MSSLRSKFFHLEIVPKRRIQNRKTPSPFLKFAKTEGDPGAGPGDVWPARRNGVKPFRRWALRFVVLRSIHDIDTMCLYAPGSISKRTRDLSPDFRFVPL